MARKGKRTRTAGLGCGYLISLAITTSLLMILNSYFVGKVVSANWDKVPEFLQDVRLFQFCQIFIPIILVIIQFRIYDRFRDSIMARRS